jgi:hypothetical protein
MAAPGDTQVLLRTAFATANERWPGLGIELPAFVDAAEAHARGRLEQLGLEATAERLAQALGRMCLEDLCLACACDAGSEEAWSAFHAGYRLRLLGLAVKQGLDRERADAQVGALLSDLALPPARVAAATLLGT